jgi:hypothetical protein
MTDSRENFQKNAAAFGLEAAVKKGGARHMRNRAKI